MIEMRRTDRQSTKEAVRPAARRFFRCVTAGPPALATVVRMEDSNTADSNGNHIHDLQARRLADAVVEMHLTSEAGTRPQRDAYRLAFVDNEFLLRRETRGIRFQLEMLKPDLGQADQGIENTVVVFGSARFVDPEAAQKQLADAQANGDTALIARAIAQRLKKLGVDELSTGSDSMNTTRITRPTTLLAAKASTNVPAFRGRSASDRYKILLFHEVIHGRAFGKA